MKKLIAVTCMLVVFTSAYAEDESPHQFSANIDLTSDYMYRGQSQTGNLPAVDGGFDYTYTPYNIYAGIWASKIDFGGNLEMDFYGGVTGDVGSTGIGWDIGGLYYYYPGQASGSNLDFFEGHVGLSYDFANVPGKPSVGVTFNYSPDWQGSTGDAVNVDSSVGFTLPQDFSLSFGVGYQTVDDNATWGTPNWTYYSIGLSKTLGPFDLGVTYYDSDLSKADCFGGTNICDGRVVFNISSSF